MGSLRQTEIRLLRRRHPQIRPTQIKSILDRFHRQWILPGSLANGDLPEMWGGRGWTHRAQRFYQRYVRVLTSILKPKYALSNIKQSRRKQIRQAQKTYRLKKEATMRSAQAQLTELKQKINGISEAFSELYHAALESDLKNTHPTLFDHFDGVKRLLAADTEELPTSSLQNVSSTGRWAASSAPKSVMSTPESATGSQPRSPSQQHVFGYCPMPSISPLSTETTPGSASLSPEDYHEPNQTHDNRQNTWGSFGKPVYTYCFQEATFSRRLQRYCLEHAFRLFSDPRSHPNGIYQVFRLVPCIQNKAKMYPHFKRLVMAGSGDSLEIQALPFYCIGGAGTHHPLLDDVGNPIYPPRMRLPKRLLGVLPVVRSASDVGSNWDTERLLEDCGFGGQWFDCRDVEGYLSAHGVHLEESFLFPRVDGLNEGGFQSVAANLSPAEQPTTSSEGQLQQIRSAGDTISTVPLRQHILDVETFFLCE